MGGATMRQPGFLHLCCNFLIDAPEAAGASVLVTEPKILVMDEPTNQLDIKNRNLVENTIRTLPEDVIVISHDLDLVAGLDRVLLVHDGRIAADGEPAAVIGEYRAMHGVHV